MGKGTPISQELKENIADDLALGYSFADIADRYGVSFSTIRRVKNNFPETVSTPIEPVPEEVPADNNISTYSIPEIPEKVKRVPESVLIVIAREISDFDDEIETLTKRLDRLKSEKSVLEKWYFDNKDGAE